MKTKLKEEDLTPKEKQMIAKVESTNAGKKMLERRAKSVSTKLQYSKASLFLSEFLNKPIDELVNEYIAGVKENMYSATDKWEEVFKDFATWLEKDKKYGSASVSVFHAGAKTLINANVPRSMRLQAETPEHESRTIAGVTIEDLKEIYAMCDVREKAFIAILKDSGISADDVLRLNYGDIKDFEKEDFIHISMYREKEKVEYETFVGPNAVEALRAYTRVRRQRGENITHETPIFASQHTPYERLNSASFSSVFGWIEKKTGKTISTHRLRKFFETYMALIVRHPIILKYWMGHRIRKGRDIEARYIIPPTPEQLKLYKESYRNIDLTGASLTDIQKRQEVAEELTSKLMAGEKLTDEDQAKIKQFGIRLLESRKKRGVNKDENCPDGEHCGEDFKQINEGALLAYLKEGWKIEHKLQDGDLIVKR